MGLRIGILGTRGIPNHYGGFEQFAEYLSAGLADKGHEVIVYNSHNHPYQQKTWNNVRIVHCYDPEKKLGTIGQFVYDLNCIVDTRRRNLDVLLMLGFTSSSAWGWLYPRKTKVVFNMDGFEWKRTKYSKPVRNFLRFAEGLAVKFGDYYVADSPLIQSFLLEKYNVPSEYIPYGAEIFSTQDERLLQEHAVNKFDYYLVIARMEPENNIELILEGFRGSKSKKQILVVGNIDNKFGNYLFTKFAPDKRIRFIGAVYNDATKLHTLRIFSYLYFHGHSVGGTNPSLLEAMASQALIAAHENPFNRAVLGDSAIYFATDGDVTSIVENVHRGDAEMTMIENNLNKIKKEFCWREIISKYDSFLNSCVYQCYPVNEF
jgi:glycosyltransferase involved in cell wall biosynthesis